ncbi:MAG: 50S ribosomal protein L6 [Nanoarchaeota archaeon]|nr:50S ribosomal protein L6 [Nanoarchaeota archaeon]
MEERIELPEGVSVTAESGMLTVKGQLGELKKSLQGVKAKVEGKEMILSCLKTTKREKKLLGTISAHVRNMISGVMEQQTYRLKICSGHFPMNVAVQKEEVMIKNFLGEKIPRTVKVKQGTEVKVDGEFVVVTSPDKELAGQMAASIQQITRRPGFDRRIFQDGIYIIERPGK